MLRVAQEYADELKERELETWFDEKYKYYYCSRYYALKDLEMDTRYAHHFVSVNKKGEVMGYIGYSIDRQIDSCSYLCLINFTNDKMTFGIDAHKAIVDIFEKFKFRKLNFTVIVGNPVEKEYDKLVKKYGGRIVGVFRDNVRLIDNKYYDEKFYEITLQDYIINKQRKKVRDSVCQ